MPFSGNRGTPRSTLQRTTSATPATAAARIFETGDAERRRRQSAAASAFVAQEGQYGVSDDGGRREHPSGGPAQRRVGEIVDRIVGDRDRAAGAEELDHQALEAEQAGQRDHERRKPETGDQQPLDGAEHGGGDQRSADRPPPGPGQVRLDEERRDGRADAGDEAERQIDLAQQKHEDLAHADQHEHCPLHQQIDEISGGEKARVLHLKDDGDQRHAEHDRQHAALSGENPRPERAKIGVEALAGCVGDDRRAHRRGLFDVVLRQRPSKGLRLFNRLAAFGRGADRPRRPSSRHQFDDASRIEPCGVALGDRPPQAQDDDAVGDGEDVVEIVGDHDDGEPMVGQAPHKLENLLRLRDAERRGRLVEDDELRVPHDRFRDRDRLALAAGERGDGLADGAQRGDAEARQGLGRRPLHIVLVEQAAAKPLAPEEHVLRRRRDCRRARGPDKRPRCRGRTRHADRGS